MYYYDYYWNAYKEWPRWEMQKILFHQEYTGETYLRYNLQETSDEEDRYYFKYRLHDVNSTVVYDEYLIYDGIGMVGSVGGTLGMFIEFW